MRFLGSSSGLSHPDHSSHPERREGSDVSYFTQKRCFSAFSMTTRWVILNIFVILSKAKDLIFT